MTAETIDHAKQYLEALTKSDKPLTLSQLNELCHTAGRQGDLALKYLKREKLAKYVKVDGIRGWVPFKRKT